MNNYKLVTVLALAIAFLAVPDRGLYAQKKRNTPRPTGTTAGSNPNDPGGHSARGIEAAKQRDYETAIAEFTKAIAAEPTDAKNYFNRGTAYRGSNKMNEALADFAKAIELAPKDAPAYVGRGEVLLVQKQLDPALADFEKALQIAPDDINARRFRGFVFISKSEWDKAIADYGVVIQKLPDAAGVYERRGLPTGISKDTTKQLLITRKRSRLIQSTPMDIVTALRLRGKWRYANAAADYRAVLKIKPEDADARAG